MIFEDILFEDGIHDINDTLAEGNLAVIHREICDAVKCNSLLSEVLLFDEKGTEDRTKNKAPEEGGVFGTELTVPEFVGHNALVLLADSLYFFEVLLELLGSRGTYLKRVVG